MSKLIDVYYKLKNINSVFISTQDAAVYLNLSVNTVNKVLARIAKVGLLIPIKRGLWVFEDVDPLILPALLTFPLPSYISLQTALYYHGMISQIPNATYAVSLARTRTYNSSLSIVSLHHVQPSMFFGYVEWNGNPLIKIATPEKALLDYFYLSQGISHLFHSLPELEIPPAFKLKVFNQMVDQVPSKQRASLIKKLFSHYVDPKFR